MRFNLKHWFIMVLITEVIVTFLIGPVEITDDIGIVWMFALIMPVMVTLLMFMIDFMGYLNEKEWAKRDKKHAEIKRTALKVIDLEDGRQVVIHKDTVHVYKHNARLFYINITSIKWLAKQIQELGL